MPEIIGIGIDLIDVADFRVHYGDDDAELFARCFTDREIADARTGQDRTQHLAGRFAAKEATFKALGGAVGIALTDIEVVRCESGPPQLQLHGPARSLAEKRGVGDFLISISHTASSAAAVVIALSKGPT